MTGRDMAGYWLKSDDREDPAVIFGSGLHDLEQAILRAREVSAVCSPREVRKGRQVIRRSENGTWVSRGGDSGERGIAG
jgi:hypothetical protein